MPRGVHNLGRKRSEGFKRRVKSGIARTQAEGRPFGRKRERPLQGSVCEVCSKAFLWTRGGNSSIATHQRTGRFCSKGCLVKWLHKHRQLLPHAEEIKRLYWDDGKSLWEIARMFGVTSHSAVKTAMAKAGVARRPKKNIGKKSCIVEGCVKPTHKILHAGNHSPYGRRCKQHWNEHRAAIQKEYVSKRPDQRARRIAYARAYYKRTREARLAYAKVYRERINERVVSREIAA